MLKKNTVVLLLVILVSPKKIIPNEIMDNATYSITACILNYAVEKKANVGNLSKSLKSQMIMVMGKCFVGTDTSTLLSSGKVEITCRPIDENSNTPYWKDDLFRGTYEEDNISSSGELTEYLNIEKNVRYYILVIPHGYGIQWWDGASIFEQPQPVDITTDTIYHDFHFQPRCSLSCAITPAKMVSAIGLADQYGFYLFPPSSDPVY